MNCEYFGWFDAAIFRKAKMCFGGGGGGVGGFDWHWPNPKSENR